MDVLIQNTGSTPYFMSLTKRENGTVGVAGRITFEADNQTTRVPQEIYETKIKNNPFWKQRIENGTLVVLNDVGTSAQKAEMQAAAARELGYSRYKALMAQVNSLGGKENPEIAGHLDRAGMPKIDLVRLNMGQVDPQKISEYRSRYLAEKDVGIADLRLPGGVKASKSSTDIDPVLNQIEDEETEIEEDVEDFEEEEIEDEETEEEENYTKEELEEKTKAELKVIAKEEFDLDLKGNLSEAKLINKILRAQNNK